ncbi:MAG TPA: ABC-three component system protein [Xanthobacteraceae bacterium]|nr:ABC-three component system protein [Xanthobacteraceae bacterium]
MGVDIAGLTDDAGFLGVWDNYQCKHYDHPLTPGTAIREIGKSLWHAFDGEFVLPRRYYFMAPQDCGMNLKKLLLNQSELKSKLIEKWDEWCANAITSTAAIPLEGKFAMFVQGCDFSRFTFKTALEAIDEHSHTPYHAARFGGGLPDRPEAETPPAEPSQMESRYLQQLFEAYGDHHQKDISCLADLNPWQELVEHYHRQREYFYHAESLRNFARDTVPAGTFEELQEEVHAGVVEIETASHPDGLIRMNEVTQAAALLPLTANGLISVTKVQDKRGICHQLANEDRLKWKK